MHNIVTNIFEIVGNELRAGRTLSIAGFGTFLTYLRPAGKYKDKITGAAVDYAEELKPYFKASKAFKEKINSDTGNAGSSQKIS